MSTLDQPAGQQAPGPAQPASPYAQPQQAVPLVPQQYAPGQQYGQPQYAPGPQYAQPQYAPAQQYAQPQYGAPVPAGYPQPMVPASQGRPLGPVGKVRSTWAVIGLSLITFGIYSLYYYFATHQEMKDHSGEGVGGVLGLVIALFTFGLVTPFLFPHEVGNLYARQGRP